MFFIIQINIRLARWTSKKHSRPISVELRLPWCPRMRNHGKHHRVLNIQRHWDHWTAHGGPIWLPQGCPAGAKKYDAHSCGWGCACLWSRPRLNTNNTVVFVVQFMPRADAWRAFGLCVKMITLLTPSLTTKWTKMRCTRWYSRCGD